MSQNDDRPSSGDVAGDAPTRAMRQGDLPGRPEQVSAFGRSEGSPGLGVTGAGRRPTVQRPPMSRAEPRGAGVRAPARSRRAKLALRRIDPWSVFLFSLLASIFLGIVLVVAVTVLYAVLANLGVLDSVNDLFGEVAGDGEAGAAGSSELITSSRVLSGAAVLAAVDIVLLTALATLGALLYNLCAALTGGIEVTLGERD